MTPWRFALDEATKWIHPGLDTLIHYVTSACNAHCDHCYFLDRLNQKNDLTKDETFGVIGKLGRIRALLVAGGEPFICRYLADVLIAYHRECGVRVAQIPTMAFHTDRMLGTIQKALTACPDLHLTVNVSLDGFAAFHNANRKVPGLFEIATNNLQRLKALQSVHPRLRVCVVTVMMPGNLADLPRFAGFIWAAKPDLHILEVLRDLDFGPYDRKEVEDLRDLWVDLTRAYYERPQNGSQHLYRSWVLSPFIKRFAVANLRTAFANFLDHADWSAPCQAGRKIAVLYPEGDVAVCELRKRVGNIKDHGLSLQAAMATPAFQEEVKKVPEDQCFCTHGCFIPVARRYSLKALVGA